jgi:predicted AAA+ superfamily ATPase
MSLPTIFDVCVPRDDVANGSVTESDYAANLANVLNRTAPPDYADAPTFFTNTFPTEGLRELLANV